jgi:crotonobetainyl-CoA:carnitine CoA-transferase CaiB-like acyl-CoA transferase
MVEAIAATVGEAWMAYLDTGEEPARLGNRDPQWAPHNCYATAVDDHWLTIACTDEDQWRGLCRVVGAGLADDPRFADAAARKAHEAALDEIIGAWARTRDEWDAAWALQAEGVAAFPSVSPLPLWTGDPQLEAIGMLERPDHPAVGRQTVPGVPWRLTNGPNGLRRPAPLLAQHTEEVLTELLGFGVEEVVRLVEVGALRRHRATGAAPAHT